MKQRKRVLWAKLDNASKIFPSTCNEKDTKVFRFACELYETVDPDILQRSLDATLKNFPMYKTVLRKGLFWYYFEGSDLRPLVEMESLPVCAPIYLHDKGNLLFRVSYYNCRINFEVFHALTDGTGALKFMQSLIYNYLIARHEDDFRNKPPIPEYSASLSKKMDDSFGRHFEGNDLLTGMLKGQSKPEFGHAYQIRGSRMEESRMNLIEGAMSAKALISVAHEYGASVTKFITGLFLYSIYQDMPRRRKMLPVVLSVPVNLRQFFQSETARNFFSTMSIGYQFSKGSDDLSQVLQKVDLDFRRKLTAELIKEQVDNLISLESNPLARITPLPVKDFFLRIAHDLRNWGTTAAISNIGQIAMPPEFSGYIRQFSISTSARKLQICMCSYGDRMVVTFTSPWQETEIQRSFFEFLTKKGIRIEISSN